MTKPSKIQQAEIRKVIANFEKDGSSDYRRMEAELQAVLGAKPDNTFTWHCVNKVETKTMVVDFSWLD